MLRTLIQRCTNTSFVFAGSKRHVMANMFTSPSKPFYQSSITMGLNPIPLDTYCQFAARMFKLGERSIDEDVVRSVYADYGGCTWFMQMMMNELFALTPTGEKCVKDMLPQAKRGIILSQEQTYKDTLSQMAPRQKMLLQAIARDKETRNITSQEFISRHSLPSASSVQSAAKGLLSSDIITKDDDAYRIYDYFFSEWLAKVY